ncbi:MAG: FKBP-type peptidyl-prolyl cis-trans isomerase [Gammaproteobacteria bacterium]|jgi:FKBP-type peptidyl-prolyl cis-trans isomerase FklB
MSQMVKNALIIMVIGFFGTANAVEIKSDKQKYSYAYGFNIANLLQASGVKEIDSEAFLAGLNDVLQGKELQMDIADMKQALEKQRDEIVTEASEAAMKKGQAFLEKNKTAEGVIILENGMQYIVLAAGDGAQPKATDKVKVHYHGTLIDGTVFDSSVDRGTPVSFPLGNVIPGFREAITRMKTGDKWRVFIPSELAYGESGAPPKIGPNETLIFEIELLEVE